MQAEEIARRMGGPLVTVHPSGYLKAIADQLDNISLVVGNDMVFVGNALRALAERLPTTEEQQALLALRAGGGTRMKVCRDNGWRWTADCDTENETLVHLFADTYVDVGGRDYAGYDTSIAALAAAGRVLEEEGKRG